MDIFSHYSTDPHSEDHSKCWPLLLQILMEKISPLLAPWRIMPPKSLDPLRVGGGTCVWVPQWISHPAQPGCLAALSRVIPRRRGPNHHDTGRSIINTFVFEGPGEKLEPGSKVGKHNWSSSLSWILVLAHGLRHARCFGQGKVCFNLASWQSLGQSVKSRTQLCPRLLAEPSRPAAVDVLPVLLKSSSVSARDLQSFVWPFIIFQYLCTACMFIL